jgi:hypothetical protein
MPPLGVFGRAAAAAAAAAAAGPEWECAEPGAEEVDAILLCCVVFRQVYFELFSCCHSVVLNQSAAGVMGKRLVSMARMHAGAVSSQKSAQRNMHASWFSYCRLRAGSKVFLHP